MPTATTGSAVTTWVETPHGGRDRGPFALARAWVEVLVRPRRFFRVGIAPGDQAPGLTFAVAVAFAYVLLRLAFVPASLPSFALDSLPATVLFVIVTALIVAPTILHLLSAAQTLALIAVVRDRGGVSQTVQVIAYASAPCVGAALPIPALRLACTAYGAILLILGLSIVHETSPGRALVAGAVPATVLFGYVFGGVPAAVEIAESLVLGLG